MDVSVIIPAKDERGYIGSMLLALEQQTYDGVWETIVVDNASSDRTGDAVRQAFPWVRVVEEPTSGVQRARERGRLAATGEIFAFLDADTIPSERWLEQGVRYFQDPSVVAVTGPYDFYDSGPFLQMGARFVSAYIYPLALRCAQDLLGRGIMAGGNCFIRARALEAIDGFNTAIEFWGDDTDTAVRLAQVGRIVYGRDAKVRTSARRYYREGILKTLWGYTYHAVRISSRALRERKPALNQTPRL
ncbi:MAG: hypothetical protein A2847_00895 [Candidatus Sungbacteria bacterium RIFCSPHIGHO2_01_FULL_50_25]|uniref:Glycosyltransferase 2-like domain-containing protein n=1 Tax=Candidatus Sungbacteria bacterium RIFCSPHIGHO2_01_FULL_50_25 TaxID=1802265 RepID=A0A1G2KBN3_9BACT|nr:MAG: hypothetical protein A2847_00895 [Candidatus Sungbacteria bacterium RIFCSPHIGHO2_01_FULL_50_25]